MSHSSVALVAFHVVTSNRPRVVSAVLLPMHPTADLCDKCVFKSPSAFLSVLAQYKTLVGFHLNKGIQALMPFGTASQRDILAASKLWDICDASGCRDRGVDEMLRSGLAWLQQNCSSLPVQYAHLSDKIPKEPYRPPSRITPIATPTHAWEQPKALSYSMGILPFPNLLESLRAVSGEPWMIHPRNTNRYFPVGALQHCPANPKHTGRVFNAYNASSTVLTCEKCQQSIPLMPAEGQTL